jgi:hypothetical protein
MIEFHITVNYSKSRSNTIPRHHTLQKQQLKKADELLHFIAACFGPAPRFTMVLRFHCSRYAELFYRRKDSWCFMILITGLHYLNLFLVKWYRDATKISWNIINNSAPIFAIFGGAIAITTKWLMLISFH